MTKVFSSAENVSWESFLSRVNEIRRQCETVRAEMNMPSDPTDVLFRGHANSQWPIQTTLERAAPGVKSVADYWERACKIRRVIESHSGRAWDIPDYADFGEYRTPAQKVSSFISNKETYSYLIYLRHHGFPSPLLDWTASPFVASYFACADSIVGADYFSIYAFWEDTGHGTSNPRTKPRIFGLGPHVRTHPRHFLQKCQYTVCVVSVENDLKICSHEQAELHETNEQNLAWKFNIPISERPKVLQFLDDVNINAHTLFGTEDGLVRAAAYKAFHSSD